MSEQWPIRSLGELCTVVNGGTPKSKVSEYWGGDINWITPAEMGKMTIAYIDDTNRKITELGLQRSSAKLFPPYSVILSTRAPIGHLAINTSPMSTNQGCKTLVPNDELDYKFLYYFLYFNKVLLNSLGTGTTFKELSGKNLKSIEIPVPPLEEQKRIVRILDEAFSRLNKCGIQLLDKTTSAENILQSTIFFELNKDSQGWSESELDKICLNITDGSHNPPKGVESSEYRMLSSRNVFNDSINFEKFRFITEEDYEIEHKRTKVESGDILLTIVGTIGRCAVVNEESLPFTLQRSVAIMKPNTQIIHPRFLMYSLMNISSSLNEQSRGAAQKGIYLKQLRKFPIQYPDLETQLSIVKKLDQISKLANQVVGNYDLGYVSLSELKQSILQEAFSGELTGGIVE